MEPNTTLKGSVSFKFKCTSNANANAADANNEGIAVLLKYFSNF